MSKILYNFTNPATVAHEGNPRTNSLAVSGTLDGSVYVAFEYTKPPLQLEAPPSTVDDTLTASSSHSQKFVFLNNFVFGNDHHPFDSDPNPLGSAAWLAPQGSVTDYSNIANVPVWGCLHRQGNFLLLDGDGGHRHEQATLRDVIVEGPGLVSVSSPNGITSANLNMYGRLRAVSGITCSGPAVAVLPESTFDDFTGLVFAYDTDTNRVWMLWYYHETLEDFPAFIIGLDNGGGDTGHSLGGLSVNQRLGLSVYTEDTRGSGGPGGAGQLAVQGLIYTGITATDGYTWWGANQAGMPTQLNQEYLTRAVNVGWVNIGRGSGEAYTTWDLMHSDVDLTSS